MTLPQDLSYLGISLAAIVEGEVAYVSAAVLVAAGRLAAVPLVIAGTIGAAMGDQLYFYLLRGRVSRWVNRSRHLASRHAAIAERVRRHHVWMILAIRFAPGLRIAIAAACAHANVPPLRFSLLNLLSAFVWAVALLALVVRGGPAAMNAFGLQGLWAAAIPAVLIVCFGWWLARRPRAQPNASEPLVVMNDGKAPAAGSTRCVDPE